MKAIVYTSNTGTTKEYAKLLAEATSLPCYELDKGKTSLVKGDDVIFLGWLMAGTVKGYKDAAKYFHIAAVCAVGMGQTGSQHDEVVKKNHIPQGTPLFTLQGGFDIAKLHGVYKMMMNTMAKTAGKSLAKKTDRTPEEDDMLDMMVHGGSRVDQKHLQGVLDWYTTVK